MNDAPEESYLFASNRLTSIVERLAAVTIADKPIVPPADLAFLSHLCAELGGLDTMIQSLTYQSLAVSRAALEDRARADFLQANNTDLLMRLRDSDAALELVTKLAETAGLKIGDALDG